SRDVDRHVAGRSLQVLKEDAGLGAAAAAVLDQQALSAQSSRHFGAGRTHDAHLSSRWVILVERGDLLKQLGTTLVVQQLARQLLLGTVQSTNHLVERSCRLGCEVVERDAVHASCATRSPENCQRASGGKKFRYVGRMWERGVAHEPPRSTYWLHMNLPLYSPRAPGAVRNPG